MTATADLAKLLDQVLIKFYWLREQSELRKKPSTSELIDWISALLRAGVSQDQLESHIPFNPASRSVKNRNGVLAAHSCPMNSSGVIGAVNSRVLAARYASAGI